MMDCEQLQTPLLDAQMALIKLRLCDLIWVAWTDFGTVGVVRRAILGKSDKYSQGLVHLRLDPPRYGFTRRNVRRPVRSPVPVTGGNR